MLPLPKSKIFGKSEAKQNKIINLSYVHENTNWKSVSFNGWVLPARSPGKWNCGKWQTKGCLKYENHPDGKAWVKHYQKSCFKASCSVCVWKYLDRESNRATTRIETLARNSQYLPLNEGYRYNPVHVVVSVPKKDWNLDYKILKSMARDMLKKSGCFGGLMVFHPFRQIEDAEDSLRENKPIGDWYWSPHFHSIAIGWISGQEVADNYHETKWVVVNLGVRRSVFQTVWYQLSHCGIKEGFHSITWWGILGYHSYYSKLKLEDGPELEDYCPFCFEPLNELIWIGADRPPTDDLIFEVELLSDAKDWEFKNRYRKT